MWFGVGGEGREAEGAPDGAPCVACGAPRRGDVGRTILAGSLLSEVSAGGLAALMELCAPHRPFSQTGSLPLRRIELMRGIAAR